MMAGNNIFAARAGLPMRQPIQASPVGGQPPMRLYAGGSGGNGPAMRTVMPAGGSNVSLPSGAVAQPGGSGMSPQMPQQTYSGTPGMGTAIMGGPQLPPGVVPQPMAAQPGQPQPGQPQAQQPQPQNFMLQRLLQAS